MTPSSQLPCTTWLPSSQLSCTTWLPSSQLTCTTWLPSSQLTCTTWLPSRQLMCTTWLPSRQLTYVYCAASTLTLICKVPVPCLCCNPYHLGGSTNTQKSIWYALGLRILYLLISGYQHIKIKIQPPIFPLKTSKSKSSSLKSNRLFNLKEVK